MPTTWILIADASRARVFAVTKKSEPWALVKEVAHPQSRSKGMDIMADKPGRVSQSKGVRHRPGMQPTTDPKEAEAERFALQLAGLLDEGHGHNAYARLVLVAPPHFLGLLRDAVSGQVKKQISATVGRDLSMLKDHELPERLADVL